MSGSFCSRYRRHSATESISCVTLFCIAPLIALPVFWILPHAVALPVYGPTLLISAAIYYYATVAMRHAITAGRESLIHARGKVVSQAGDRISVRVQGELWSAHAHEQLEPGDLIGVPGPMAPKQEGQQVLKRRCLRLDVAPTPAQGRQITETVAAMMGVREVAVEGREVHITYDLLEATEAQIERTLAEAGARLGSGWAERLRRALVHYAEDCEAANMEVTDRPPHHHG